RDPWAPPTDGCMMCAYHTTAWPVTYQFPVPNGSYWVRLGFHHNSYLLGGQVVENVSINGSSVLSNFDAYTAAGGPHQIYQSFPVTVRNGSIVILISPLLETSHIGAIAIVQDPTPSLTVYPRQVTLSARHPYQFSVDALGLPNSVAWSTKIGSITSTG